MTNVFMRVGSGAAFGFGFWPSGSNLRLCTLGPLGCAQTEVWPTRGKSCKAIWEHIDKSYEKRRYSLMIAIM